ncbi:hypothetical protein [Candidatus Nitrosotenuis uzonensis]|uniref:hypothetical protein n=1 Tax=Candidatus Nitrosotenuis uzonensis TaxID=1407055 RepID=UPI001EF9CB94|nr:hypothetical protein [Candidatus Nitrosotenuis uzonensis]
MELEQTLRRLSFLDHPSGLGGCKSHGTTLDCCEYDVTVFDKKIIQPEVFEFDGNLVRIHHGNIEESNPDVLQKYEHMSVISDSEWKLQMLMSKIKEKKDRIRNTCIKNHLIDAALYAARAKKGSKRDPFAPAWVKCAAYCIADALVLYNRKQRSPTHMLEFIRKSEKSKENEFTIAAEVIGLERATPSLLERMAKSTIGFSDMTENNGHAKIILKKYEYLTNNSLLSDCYFYLGYINRNNLLLIKDQIHRRQDLVHVLKTAMDFEHDVTKIEKDASSLHNLANDLVSSMCGHA